MSNKRPRKNWRELNRTIIHIRQRLENGLNDIKDYGIQNLEKENIADLEQLSKEISYLSQFGTTDELLKLAQLGLEKQQQKLF